MLPKLNSERVGWNEFSWDFTGTDKYHSLKFYKEVTVVVQARGDLLRGKHVAYFVQCVIS